jgi:adenine-specific DNA-methyltransferase
MEKLDPKIDGSTVDIVQQNLDKLKKLFPSVFTEGKIDFEALRETLGDYIDDRPERYSLAWNGKSRARRIAQTPSTGTLLPFPDESVNWDTTQNLFIEGDNLEVLKLLQKSYHRRVKLIYIDPPYNTGNEFIYPDKFQDNLETYLRYTGQVTEEGFKLSANAETSGRYHTNWLNMMYPRLKLARNLLRDDGAMFISIDDNECHNLRHLCNEVFGEENFKADIAWQKRYTRSNNTVDFTAVVEHILVYARSEWFVVNLLPRTDEADARYTNPDGDPRGPWKGASFLNPATPAQRPNLCYEITNPNTGDVVSPTTNAWRRSKDEFHRLAEENCLYWGADGQSPVPSIKMFLSEARGLTPTNFWSHDYAGNTDDGTSDLKQLFEGKVFDNPKPVQLMKRVLEHACDADSIILDFFAGSCTLPQAVLEKNLEDEGRRRFIAVQLPEACDKSTGAFKHGLTTIAEIGKERIRQVIKTHHSESLLLPTDVDLGFRVLKLTSSNIIPWDGDFDNLEESLFNSIENIKPDRTESDVLYELLLKYGLDLAVPIDKRTIVNTQVFVIGAGALIVCLANNILPAVADGIAQLRNELEPEIARVVFKDSGFASDVDKTNALQILAHSNITDVKSI